MIDLSYHFSGQSRTRALRHKIYLPLRYDYWKHYSTSQEINRMTHSS